METTKNAIREFLNIAATNCRDAARGFDMASATFSGVEGAAETAISAHASASILAIAHAAMEAAQIVQMLANIERRKGE